MKKVLIIYGSVGLGHKIVAENIAAVLKTYPGVELRMLDVLEMYRGPFTQTSTKIYQWIIAHWPALWRFFYTNPVFLKLTLPWRLPFAALKLRKFREYFLREVWDLVLTTHPNATALIVNLKRQGLYQGPIVTTFSDFHFQPYWVFPGVDRYLVMTPEQQREVGRLGFAKQRIIVTGLPVDPLFAKDYEEAEVYKQFGLTRGKPIVLVMGGSRGWGVRIENILALLDSAFAIQIVVVAGINPELERVLRELALRQPLLKVFGNLSSSEVAQLFAVAKILVTKPGGLTVAQALLKHLPMVLVSPLPGMEELNLRYLQARGVGLEAKNSAELRAWVERLLADKKFYQDTKNRTRVLAQPRAAALAAQAVIDMF